MGTRTDGGSGTSRALLMDCSPGTDDAVAIATAVASDRLDLIGVSTVGASRTVGEVTDNALRLLDLLGSDAPVVVGAGRPIGAGHPGYGSATFGAGAGRRPGLGLPPTFRRPAGEDAAGFIVRTARRHPGAVTLLATGPLTNVAAALAREPGLFDLLHRVVVMGGGDRSSNVTAAAEFNFWADPVAAGAVLSARPANLTLVTLDATLSAPLGLDDAERFARNGGRAGAFVAAMVRERIAKPASSGADGVRAPVHDAVCVAALLDERVVTAAERCEVTVCPDGPARGRSVIDTRPWRRGEGDVEVVWRAAGPAVADAIADALSSAARGAVPPRARRSGPPPRSRPRVSA